MTYKLLIVDDEMPNIRLLERLFQHEYQCLTAWSGEEAMSLLDQHEVAVIITDQRMPQMTGIELLKRSADRRPHMVRILLTGYTDLEALVEAVNCGLVYTYVSKPWNNDDLKLRVGRAVEAYENNKRQHLLAANNERLTSRIKAMRIGFVRAMTAIMQMHDTYLYSHAVRVSELAGLLGEKLGLSEQMLSDLSAASFLHELGLVGSGFKVNSEHDDSFSPDQLTARAAELIAGVEEFKDVADGVRYHYENFDGSGAPLGLIGDQIPLIARVLRVAKEFDLFTNPRDKAQALTPELAVERLQNSDGKEFDPVVVEMFCEVISGSLVPA